MTKTEHMNGVIRIGRRSLRKFQFEDAGPVVEFDVIEVSDQWHEVNFALRVKEGDDLVLPPEKFNEFKVNQLNFVQSLVNDAYEKLGAQAPQLTRGEAEEFIRQVQEATVQLRNFTSPRTDETSSAPESMDRGLDFSQ